MTTKFGILMPVTSRGTNESIVENLREFLLSFKKTKGSYRGKVEFYFGIDNGDIICEKIDYNKLCNEYIKCKVIVVKCNYPPGFVCAIWRDLASTAYRRNCTYFVLFGDDIVLKSENWMSIINQHFRDIHENRDLPFGVGCVSLYDETFPGMPTFPVVHRSHMDIFEGNILPQDFINQDGDPFLFQLYRSFGASKVAKEAVIFNSVGGSRNGRYQKEHIDWTNSIIKNARSEVETWLLQRQITGKRLIELDVIIPTFRGNLDYIEKILSISVPDICTTQFIVVFDNPNSNIKHLQTKYAFDPSIRLRSNEENMGASVSRNRGIEESSAEWILFLDDDVIPDDNILHAYCSKILEHPLASGFIGSTKLPMATNSRENAIVLAQLTYFWDIASRFPDQTELPWGVTANLCARRSSVRFRNLFPKTGGGEDIDYCLQTRIFFGVTHEGFVAAPNAIAVHPWWNGGRPSYSRFFRWAYGDSLLIELYPHLCYLAFPNLAETIITSLLVCVVLTVCSLLQNLFGYLLLFILTSILSDIVLDSYNAYHTLNDSSISLSSKLSSTIQSTIVRSYSEFGRIYGSLERWTFFSHGICRRFNWFGNMWPGAIQVEIFNSFIRFAMRFLFTFLILFLINKYKN